MEHLTRRRGCVFFGDRFLKNMLSNLASTTRAALGAYTAVRLQVSVALTALVAVRSHGSREDVYNILWAVVFGFATLNILGLASRRLEPNRRGMSFGELMAVLVVVLSVVLLGWEMMNLFHIFPIKLRR
ncbi:MAG TPA: hypothetical protein VIW68_09865 [Candidatus Sulfotelmatobacter sp.]